VHGYLTEVTDMFCSFKALRAALLAAVVASGSAWQAPALASDAGAFIGGMVTSHVLRNMDRRTQAEEAQAYYASRPAPQAVQQAAPARSSAPEKLTPEQRLQQLDKLAAGGYITPEEYKAKKKQIVDGM
jgi:uncharacterized protein YciW